MPYPTILVHADDSAGSPGRIALAVALARRANGHLVGMAVTGVARGLYATMPPEQNDPTLALHLGFLRQQANEALSQFTLLCEGAALPSYEARMIDDDAAGGLSLHGRTADLIVLSQADPEHDGSLLADLAAGVVLHAGRPVLLVPCPGYSGSVGKRVLVSWDGSREAARALQLALPMLRQAERVEIAVFAPHGEPQVAADARAADPVPWLARHGIDATLTIHPLERRRTRSRRHEVGDALLALAASSDADLLVMGAYGHSRMRETILGGVTRTVFEHMTVPVLVAH